MLVSNHSLFRFSIRGIAPALEVRRVVNGVSRACQTSWGVSVCVCVSHGVWRVGARCGKMVCGALVSHALRCLGVPFVWSAQRSDAWEIGVASAALGSFCVASAARCSGVRLAWPAQRSKALEFVLCGQRSARMRSSFCDARIQREFVLRGQRSAALRCFGVRFVWPAQCSDALTLDRFVWPAQRSDALGFVLCSQRSGARETISKASERCTGHTQRTPKHVSVALATRNELQSTRALHWPHKTVS